MNTEDEDYRAGMLDAMHGTHWAPESSSPAYLAGWEAGQDPTAYDIADAINADGGDACAAGASTLDVYLMPAWAWSMLRANGWSGSGIRWTREPRQVSDFGVGDPF